MSDQAERRSEARQRLLARIVSTLESDPRVTACWLAGSLGRGGGDPLSDLDLVLAIEDAEAGVLCERPYTVAGKSTPARLKLLASFGTPAIIHENLHNAPDGGTFSSIIYLENALTVDWILIPYSVAIRPAATRLLLEKRPIRVVEAQAGNAAERGAAASEAIAFAWMMLAVACKAMLRGNAVSFHQSLDSVDRSERRARAAIEAKIPEHRSGSLVALALTREEQAAAVRHYAERLQSLAPQALAIGGEFPSKALEVIQQLLDLRTSR